MDIILFLLIVLLPGYLLSRVLFKEIDYFLILPFSFVFGLLLMIPVAITGYFFSLTFLQASAIIVSYLSILFLVVLIRNDLTPRRTEVDVFLKLILFITIGILISMFFTNPNFDGDALYHLGQVRKLAENSPINPTEAFFPINEISPAYGYSIWYFLVALISNLSKTDTVTVWSHLVIILVPISLLSFFTFAYSLFRDKLPALISLLIYILIIGYFSNGWEFRIVPYPDQVARHIILYLALYFFLELTYTKKKFYFYLASITGASLATVHLLSWVHFILTVGAFGVFGLLILGKRYFLDSLKICLATVVLTTPYLYLKLQNFNSVVEEPYLKKDALYLFDHVFIVNPLSRGPVFFLVLVILIYLVFTFRKSIENKIWLIYLSSSAFAALFILFNPLFTPVVAKIVTFTYTRRLGSLVYVELIFAAFLTFIVFGYDRLRPVDPLIKRLIVIFSVLLIVLIPVNYIWKVPRSDEKDTAILMEFINKNVPKKSVFAADMWTSYRIPAYTNNYIVMAYPNHTTWNVNKQVRLKDLKLIFSSEVGMKDTGRVLRSYDVSYVVINNRPRSNDILISQTKFEGKNRFLKVYSNDTYKVYRYAK